MEKDIKELIRIVIGKTETGLVLYAKRFEVLRFTPKGCWILISGHKGFEKRFNAEKWVSLHSMKRFAYPTLEEARFNFQKRKQWELIHRQKALNLLEQRIKRIKATHKMSIDKSISILELPKGEFVHTFT